jgi:hypothetical protein
MGTAAVVAAIRDEERRTLETFRQSAATRRDAAKSVEELGLRGTGALRRYLRDGVVHRVGDKRYYLDEGALDDFENRVAQRRVTLLVTIVVGAMAAWLWSRKAV